MYSAHKAMARLRSVAPGVNLKLIPGAGHAFLRSHLNIENDLLL